MTGIIGPVKFSSIRISLSSPDTLIVVMDKCSACGARDGSKLGSSTVSICPCICFEFAFCGEACLQAHEHSRVDDSAHYSPPIEALTDWTRGVKRRVLGDRYEVLLVQYVMTVREAAQEYATNKALSKTSKEMLMRTFPEKFGNMVSSKHASFVDETARGYSKVVIDLMTENEIEAQVAIMQLETASRGLLDIWSKTRLREKSKEALRNAWRTFNEHLGSFITQVATSVTGVKSAEVTVAYNSLITVARRVGHVLNGQNAM